MSSWVQPTKGRVSRNEALRSLGSVVYAARLKDGTVKIGYSENFADRLRSIKSYTGQGVELLAFRPGTYDDEQAIHAALSAFRAPITKYSREYYMPAPDVLAVVNEMRSDLGMDPIAA